jgi:Tfp pilus assembly protein PilN
MIKINLLPARKPKRASADPANKAFGFGLGSLGVIAVFVFLFVDRPRRSELSDISSDNEDLQNEINAKSAQLKGYTELKQAADEAQKRADSIDRLNAAKVVPANVLHELGEILTMGKGPTMSEEMSKKTGNGPESDPNKRFQLDWDPAHVWLTGFTDQMGVFKLEGGAQAESDVIQLSKRLAASVYFMEVTPSGGERTSDHDTGLQYYHFVISGKVAY